MRTYHAQMNTSCSAAAACSGWFCAAVAFVAAFFAGIAAAVSVVFFAVDVLAVRLLGVIIISLLLAVIIRIPAPPILRKR